MVAVGTLERNHLNLNNLNCSFFNILGVIHKVRVQTRGRRSTLLRKLM